MGRLLVTQGHEKSIGLEVFLKSFLLLPKEDQKKIILFSLEENLIKAAADLNLNIEINKDSVYIGNSLLKLVPLTSEKKQSLNSLEIALASIKDGDVLLTIPTTKQELSTETEERTGHTDYFRKKYPSHFPVMLFQSENLNLALLTEHITLDAIEDSITKDLILKKIESLLSYENGFKKFIFTGVNPHCGESGMLGKTDDKLKKIITELKAKYSQIEFEGPISADTILCDTKSFSKTDCLIASYHDQGLAPFKALSGIRASNITVGLPFLRLSPDHGTAFEIYGKNKANYYGMLFTLRKSLNSLRKHGN